MKKFMLIVFAVAIAAAITYTAANGYTDEFIEKTQNAGLSAGVEKVEVYAKGLNEDYTYTSTGAFYVYGCKLSSAGIITANVDNILGTAVFYDRELALSDVLEAYGACSVIIQSAEDCINVYAYADGLGQGVEIDGKAINVQIVLKEGKTVVGCPLVMGSY